MIFLGRAGRKDVLVGASFGAAVGAERNCDFVANKIQGFGFGVFL